MEGSTAKSLQTRAGQSMLFSSSHTIQKVSVKFFLHI